MLAAPTHIIVQACDQCVACLQPALRAAAACAAATLRKTYGMHHEALQCCSTNGWVIQGAHRPMRALGCKERRVAPGLRRWWAPWRGVLRGWRGGALCANRSLAAAGKRWVWHEGGACRACMHVLCCLGAGDSRWGSKPAAHGARTVCEPQRSTYGGLLRHAQTNASAAHCKGQRVVPFLRRWWGGGACLAKRCADRTARKAWGLAPFACMHTLGG